MEITPLPNGGYLIDGQRWIDLETASALKNVKYKTLCNNTELQPLHGAYQQGPRPKQWKAEIILEWLEVPNTEMKGRWEKSHKK